MRVVIDLIEDLREAISNQEDFRVMAMLLREDSQNKERLEYVGEAHLSSFDIDRDKKQTLFSIDSSKPNLNVVDIVAPLLILPMADMMYEIRVYVNEQYPDMEIVGFAKNEDEKKYFFMLKI